MAHQGPPCTLVQICLHKNAWMRPWSGLEIRHALCLPSQTLWRCTFSPQRKFFFLVVTKALQGWEAALVMSIFFWGHYPPLPWSFIGWQRTQFTKEKNDIHIAEYFLNAIHIPGAEGLRPKGFGWSVNQQVAVVLCHESALCQDWVDVGNGVGSTAWALKKQNWSELWGREQDTMPLSTSCAVWASVLWGLRVNAGRWGQEHPGKADVHDWIQAGVALLTS